MSYEDVIRVAQVKLDPARFDRIARDMALKPDQPFTVTEFLKPGVEEFCSVLPPWLASRILALAERYPAFGRAHWGMAVNTASITGYLRFAVLAKLRPFRRKTFRYQQEQRAIEAWLRHIVQAAGLSSELALEIAECARLIKGYGDTHKRGTANYRLIETELMLPALAGNRAGTAAAEGIANARTAALLDPDGEALTKCLAEIEVTIGAQDRRGIMTRSWGWPVQGVAKITLRGLCCRGTCLQRRGRAGAIGVLSRVTR